MRWRKLSLNTTTEAVDLVSNMLYDLGVEGIEIEDKVSITPEEKKQMFIDYLPELGPDDGKAILSFYIEDKEYTRELMNQIITGLEELAEHVDIGDGTIEMSHTQDEDWINNWKEFFKPFRVDESIVIKPTWEEYDQVDEQELVIEIDPGIAFGTGSHETTKLCILGLKKHMIQDSKVLDVGCGSGILSILALKLGAKSVLGTDIDPNAITATCQNAEVNNIVSDTLTVMSGNIIEDEILQEKVGYEEYDMVVANILADVIIPLSGVVKKHLKPGGLFITSGIIHTKRKEVEESILANGFQIVEIKAIGEWVSIVGKA